MSDTQNRSANANTGSKSIQNTEGNKSAFNSEDGSSLEQFISFMKENWKPVLSELVAAGVTAYLTHDQKSKLSKTAKN